MHIWIILIISKVALCTSENFKKTSSRFVNLEITSSDIKELKHQYIPKAADSVDSEKVVKTIHWSKSNPLVKNITGEVFRNSEINYG
jgi:hypothetical protein